MSLKLVAEIDKADLPDIGGVARAVLLELALYANDDGANCRPSVSTLARKTQFDRRTVIRSVATLERSGILSKLHRSGQCGGYRIALDQCRRVTSVTKSPVTESHPTSVRESPEPVSESHPLLTLSVLSQDSVEAPTAAATKKPADSSPPFPFQSERGLSAWAEWQQHCRENRLRTLKPTSLKRKFSEFSEWGEARTIAAIERSIAQGWQSIFEDKHGSNGKHPTHNRGNRNINTANQFVPEDAYDLSKRPTEPDDESLDDKPF